MTCFACGQSATKMFALPPLFLLPEMDEFSINFKDFTKQLPSCEHHSFDSIECKRFVLDVLRSVPWNNVFCYFRDPFDGQSPNIIPKSEYDLSRAGAIDERTLNEFAYRIALAIYYYEHKTRAPFKRHTVLTGFLERDFLNAKAFDASCRNLTEVFPVLGKFPAIFSYQIIPLAEVFADANTKRDYHGCGLLIKFSFYGGAVFFTFLDY